MRRVIFDGVTRFVKLSRVYGAIHTGWGRVTIFRFLLTGVRGGFTTRTSNTHCCVLVQVPFYLGDNCFTIFRRLLRGQVIAHRLDWDSIQGGMHSTISNINGVYGVLRGGNTRRNDARAMGLQV